MRKITNIILGWWFWVTNRNNHLAQERLQHCAYCQYRRGVICSQCGCVLQAKARIEDEECPKDFWPNYYTWFRQQTRGILEKQKRMKLAAVYNTWNDWELLLSSVKNIAAVVDGVIIVYSKKSNYGEEDTLPVTDISWPDNAITASFDPNPAQAMHNETQKRNYGLNIARSEGYTHYLCMDSDEFYNSWQVEAEKIKFIDNPELAGLVCPSRVYFGHPELSIGMDTTLVPFIHKITPTLKHEFNRRYPFAWEGRNIRIDPTRSFNIDSGVEMSPIIMEHFSWVRKDMEAYKRKIRNSTARHNLERSNILQDLVNAREGYFCQFYQKHLVRVPNRFNIPYGELSNEDLQSLASADPSS